VSKTYNRLNKTKNKAYAMKKRKNEERDHNTEYNAEYNAEYYVDHNTEPGENEEYQS